MDCVVQNLKLSTAHPLEWASLQDHGSVQNSDLLLSEIISLVKVCKVATGPQNFVPESSDSLWALFCKIRSDPWCNLENKPAFQPGNGSIVIKVSSMENTALRTKTCRK